jgi:hypothetical protein
MYVFFYDFYGFIYTTFTSSKGGLMKKAVVFLFLTVLFAVSCSAQSSGPSVEKGIVGSWEVIANNACYNLYSGDVVFGVSGDLKGGDHSTSGKYGVAGDKIYIIYGGCNGIKDISISSDGKTMILKESSSQAWLRKK